MFAHKKLFPSITFISFVHLLLMTALQSSFYVSAFVQLIFVLIEEYQVKFCQTETNNLKSILSNIILKSYFVCSATHFSKN